MFFAKAVHETAVDTELLKKQIFSMISSFDVKNSDTSNSHSLKIQ